MAKAADQQNPAGNADEWQRLISAGKEHLIQVPLPSTVFPYTTLSTEAEKPGRTGGSPACRGVCLVR